MTEYITIQAVKPIIQRHYGNLIYPHISNVYAASIDTIINNNNNNDDRLTAFDPGQPG